MKNLIASLFIIATLLSIQACSIPASCENSDYVGEWSGTSECDSVDDDEITVFIDEDNNSELTLSYYNNVLDAVLEDCFIKAEGSIGGTGYVTISGTKLLGTLSLNIEENYGLSGTNNCTANLRK